MRVDAFDFDLPETSIALRPAVPRESARLLKVASSGALEDRRIGDLPELLEAGDVLVLNDTRVVPARLIGTRRRNEASARIEAMLHLREGRDRWRAFLKPAKKVAVGEKIEFADGRLIGEVAAKSDGGDVLIVFDRSGPDLDAAIASAGLLPLPPYIASKRPVDAADATDYQTIYAREDGAVAAPTAGLHFTDALMAALSERGVSFEPVTLHVGAGTFLPVKAETTEEHRMHAEIGRLSAAAATRLNTARAAGRRIIAVGTTSLRLIESAAAPDGTLHAFDAPTDIFIAPGYRFRAVDRLLTNFHLPRSTLFMLVSAFSGLSVMQNAYRHAVETGYRFYSYGDACLLDKSEPST